MLKHDFPKIGSDGRLGFCGNCCGTGTHGAGAHASHEPTASGGAQRRTALHEAVVAGRGTRTTGGVGSLPWTSRRRRVLLELLDRFDPTIANLTQTIEQEAEKCPAARRWRTSDGVVRGRRWPSCGSSGERNGFSVASRSRAIWDWCRRRSRAGIGDGWDTSASKATRCCASCWWKRRK